MGMSAVADPLRFVVTDVMGYRRLEETVDGHRTAEDVATSMAEALDLPTDTPWSLRDERHARMLRQDEPLGSQVEQDAELVVIPQAHLG
jgi:hypothetical protein